MESGAEPLVLIVDDDEDARISCAVCLFLRGFRVTTAEDGEQALTQAAELLPDLILMDFSLPVLDGLEATRRLKKAELTRNIPVVGLTGYSENLQEALAAGCVAVLTKPVGPVELATKIRGFLAVKIPRQSRGL